MLQPVSGVVREKWPLVSSALHVVSRSRRCSRSIPRSRDLGMMMVMLSLLHWTSTPGAKMKERKLNKRENIYFHGTWQWWEAVHRQDNEKLWFKEQPEKVKLYTQRCNSFLWYHSDFSNDIYRDMFCYPMPNLVPGLDIHICSLLQYSHTCDCTRHLSLCTRWYLKKLISMACVILNCY